MDDKSLTPPGADGPRGTDEAMNGGEDAADHRTRPAGERFPFHPPLVGADPDLAVAYLREIDVGPPRRERAVRPDPPDPPDEVDLLDRGNEQDDVRHSRVEKGVPDLLPAQHKRPVYRKPAGRGHLELDAASRYLGVDEPRQRFERHRLVRKSVLCTQPSCATAPVPAHLRHGPVRV